MRTRNIRSLIYFAAGLGLIVAIYALIETVQASLQKYCTVNAYFSCGAVASSGRTTTFGIPDAWIGVGGFVLILILAGIAESRRRELLWPYLLLLVTTVGAGFSLYFLYVELALIHALCPVCLCGWICGWAAWAGSILLVRKVRAKARSRAPSPAPGTVDSQSAATAPQKG